MNPTALSRALASLAALFWLLLAGCAGPAASTWRAGVAREDITPPAGVWMTGYAVRDRPADGAAQALWVKALAFADPAGNQGVLLTADLCGITREISERVAGELAQRHRLPRSAVLINVSHTHCSPWLPGNVAGLRIFPPDGVAKAHAYARELEAKMIRAGSAALAALAPATLTWGEDTAHFGFNRRENPIAEVPARRAAGTLKGPFDPRVPVLAVRGAAGDVRALLVSYACHNTTLDFYQWHGDYAGSAQLELERRHPGALALFASGCGADANPAPRRELAHADQHGRELADAADRVLGRPMKPIAGTFRSAFAEITLAIAREPTAGQLREAQEKEQPNKEMHQAWAAAVIDRRRRLGDATLQHAYPVQAWTLGDLSWAALGGEVVIDYSNRLRREVGGDLWVLGYCNDVMAYIPSERVLREGRYEGASSMIPFGLPGPWSPGLEDKIVAQARELIAGTRAMR